MQVFSRSIPFVQDAGAPQAVPSAAGFWTQS
jgi:hypothetical protein